MAAKLGATGRRLELGLQLRGLREAHGLTRKQAVVGLTISEATLQRIERGGLNFRNVGNLNKLLDMYGVTDEAARAAIIERNRESPEQDWLTQYRGVMPPGMPSFIGMETEAQAIRAYHPTMVHGLLQTEAYARACFELARDVEDTTRDFIQRSVELRMGRKDILTRESDPAKLWMILSEVALRWTVGEDELMSNQYEEIARLASLDNVRIQVLPLASRGYRTIYDFALLDLGASLPQMVQVDSAWEAVAMTDKAREVGRFSRRFDAMVASARPPEETIGFMRQLQREL